MRLPFKIALRFLTSNKGQTILIALGIAVGVSVQIFIGSLIQGLQKSLINKTVGNSSQITILSNKEDKKISNYKQILDTAENSDKGIINLTTSADGAGLVKRDNKTYSILVRGFDISTADKIYNIRDRIYEGKEPSKDYEVLIGRNLKEELGINIGDSIDIIATSGSIETVKITGFYDLKVAAINKSWMITTLGTSQKIFKYEDTVTSIEMQVKEVFKADEIASNLVLNLPKEFKVENWKTQNAELLSGLNGQSVSSIMIQVFVLIAVVLGIASVLAITVLQKSKQIGILKAMGIKDKAASLIFLFQGLLLGVLGAVLGVALGLLLSFVFTKFALNPDGTPVVALYIDYKFIALSALIALASSTVAALIPARRSSKLNPMEVIRNG
jgi:lipoprotein-releasing system permease protein